MALDVEGAPQPGHTKCKARGQNIKITTSFLTKDKLNEIKKTSRRIREDSFHLKQYKRHAIHHEPKTLPINEKKTKLTRKMGQGWAQATRRER